MKRQVKLKTMRWWFAIIALAGVTPVVKADMPVAQHPASLAAPHSPTWVVDPYEPGENLPPVGRSLFDFIVTEPRADKMIYNVLFPFARLLKKIESQLSERDSGASPLRRVLIPMGRSLQRSAAAPEFFKYPRALVAVDTESLPRPGQAGLLLKDRLYLGYQEKAKIIEVISYNEAAGRFEFQIVKDYRPGGVPQVYYANRALCTACHQNAAPIFARPLWDETNANPEVASRLEAAGHNFYGFPVNQGVDIAYAIDAATDRANRFSVYQLLWREACDAEAFLDAIRCRAGLFTAVLQYRLSGSRYFDDQADSYRKDFVVPFKRQWQKKWPGGLAIPDPDVPNRNPLAKSVTQEFETPLLLPHRPNVADDTLRRADVAAPFEPLLARRALEIWLPPSSEDAAIAAPIAGLSGFISDSDMRRLDRYLFAKAQETGAVRQHYSSVCHISSSVANPARTKTKLVCHAPKIDNAKIAASFDLLGRIYWSPDKRVTGYIERVIIGGNAINDLDVIAGTLETKDSLTRLTVKLAQKNTGWHVRLPDGRALEKLSLSWPRATTGAYSVRATLTVMDDFSTVRAAIADLMVHTAQAKSDVFSAKPFRRAVLMPALFAQLRMAPVSWCCNDDGGMPPARLESDIQDPTTAPDSPGAVKLFYRYCAQCHRTADHFPPNFLAGEPAQVQANLAHCAERLFFRLSMWQFEAHARPKTPMPPLYALQAMHVTPEQWPRHADFAALRDHAGALLQAQTGVPPRLADLTARGYGDLRSCLPAPY